MKAAKDGSLYLWNIYKNYKKIQVKQWNITNIWEILKHRLKKLHSSLWEMLVFPEATKAWFSSENNISGLVVHMCWGAVCENKDKIYIQQELNVECMNKNI